MSYIPQDRRKVLLTGTPENCGELNYRLVEIINKYVAENNLKYSTINEVISALVLLAQGTALSKLGSALNIAVIDYCVSKNNGLTPGEQTLVDVNGALMCQAFEFYRRIAVPYQDGKMDMHGDVYDFKPAPVVEEPKK